MLERTRGPHHIVCGEFLSEEAQVALASLGLDLQALGATSIRRFRLVKGERQATTPLPFAAAGLSRFRLDEALLAGGGACRSRSRARRRWQAVEADERHGHGADRTADLAGAAVALATGKHPLRGLRAPLERHGRLQAAPRGGRWHRELAGIVQLVFFRGGYVGACLVEDGILSIAWVMQRSLVRARSARIGRRRGTSLARQSSLIRRPARRRQAAACQARRDGGHPLWLPAARSHRPDIFPVGDQLAVVPSFTGDGMAIALYTGLGGRARRCWRDSHAGHLPARSSSGR